MTSAFDRSAEDIGNIVHLEHVNLTQPDQRLATQFYVSALGLTRDPYMQTGTDNMWVNAGRTQFHLPSGAAQRLRGTVNVVIPGRQALLERLRRHSAGLSGTLFRFAEHADHVEAQCPWGNRLRCYEPDPARFGGVQLGIASIEFDVPHACAVPIAAFYSQVFRARAKLSATPSGAPSAWVQVGAGQALWFTESAAVPAHYDGHHIQLYVADFSGPHRRLAELALVSEESNAHQYRFTDIVDPQTRELCFRLEHEVRSLTHPMHGRPLVNRNPQQSARHYVRGGDAFMP